MLVARLDFVCRILQETVSDDGGWIRLSHRELVNNVLEPVHVPRRLATSQALATLRIVRRRV